MKQCYFRILVLFVCIQVGAVFCGFVDKYEVVEAQVHPAEKYGSILSITTIKINDIPDMYTSAAVGPNAKQLAFCKGSNAFFIRDLNTGATIVYPTKDNIYQVKYSADGTILMAGRNVLDIKDNTVTQLATSAKISQSGDKLAFNPSGKNIAIYNDNLAESPSVIEIWDIETKKLIKKLPIQELFQSLDGKGAGFNSMVYSPDGCYLVVAARSFITMWDIQDGKCIKVLEDDNKEFSLYYESIAYNSDGKHVAVVAGRKPSEQGEKSDILIEIWDVEQKKVVKELIVNSVYGLFKLKYSPDGIYLATGTTVGFGNMASVLIWNANSGELIREIAEGPGGFISCLDFSMDGKVISASNNFCTKIWSFK